MPVEIVLPVRTLALLLFLAVTLTGAGLAYTYLPRATVVLHPTTYTKEVEQTIVLSSATKEPDFIRYVLPARIVETEVTESKTVERTDAAGEVTEDFAKGTVTLINEQLDEQNLLPKTHLRHEESGVFFLTDNAVSIPPQSQVDVSVTAKEAGATGNVAAGAFVVDKLPASLQAVIYGKSEQAFTGGIATQNAVTESELSQAKQSVIDAAKERAIGDLTLQAGGARIHPDLITAEAISENVSAEPGSKTQSYTINTVVKARGFVVDENDLLGLTLLALRSDTSAEEEFISYEPESFSLTIDRADFARGETQVTGKLSGIVARKVSTNVLNVSDVIGLNDKEIHAHYEQASEVGEVEVTFWPFWVTSVPARAQAVEISIDSATD